MFIFGYVHVHPVAECDETDSDGRDGAEQFDNRRWSRRQMLAIGTATTAGIAGCAQSGGDSTPLNTGTPRPQTEEPTPTAEPVEEQLPPAPDEPLNEIEETGIQFDGSPFQGTRLFERVGWMTDDSQGPTFEDWSGKEANWIDTIGGQRRYDKSADRVIEGQSAAMLTSRLDWKWQAPEAAKQQLQFAPVAKQFSESDGEPIGAVEFGLVFPADESDRSPLVGAFFEYLQEEGWSRLGWDDVYHFLPPQMGVSSFEVPDYFAKPAWEREEFPPMWYGSVRTGASYMYTTQFALTERARMAGFNAVSATHGTEPFLNYLEEHGMVRNGPIPEEPVQVGYYGEHSEISAESVERANHHPAAGSIYLQNEHSHAHTIEKIYKIKDWRDGSDDGSEEVVCQNLQCNEEEFLEIQEELTERHGDLETARERLGGIESQFRSFLRDQHGDLNTLNDRWDENYDSWSDVPLPAWPTDEIQALAEKTGYVPNTAIWGRIIFHHPGSKQFIANRPKLLDLDRFARTVWARRYEALAGDTQWSPVEENRIADLPIRSMDEEGEAFNYFVTTKGGATGDAYLHRTVPEFNGVGYDHPSGKMPPQFNQYLVDTYQIEQRMPVWNSEHHIYNNWNGGVQTARYGILKDRVVGQFMDLNYQYEFTFEEGKMDIWDMNVETNRQMRRHEDALRALYGPRRDADLTVLYSEANRGWNLWPEHTDRPELGEATHAYAHMMALGKPWRYVLDRDIDGDTVGDTIVVAAPWMTQETAERLASLPDDRRIVVVGELPRTDEYGQRLSTVDQLQERSTIVSGWENLVDEIPVRDGLREPFTTPDTAEFRWWSVTHGGTRFTIPVPKLEVRTGSRDGSDYLAIINHHWEGDDPEYDTTGAIDAAIPWAAGREIRELTTEHPEPWIYGKSETTTFGPETVSIFALSGQVE
jgi:hypothetical protein